MSSHREAPQISKDPNADSTDVYAFISTDTPGSVTLICNYIPLQLPDGGPNFNEFADDVLYAINIDNTGSGNPAISFQFKFTTTPSQSDTFLYNDGPITSPTAATWNRPQTYTLTRVDYAADGSATSTVLGQNLVVPPCNVGPGSTPNYVSALVAPSIQKVGTNITVFAGQRAEGFYVDLGTTFDLGTLRPFASMHAFAKNNPNSKAPGVNSTSDVNVHSLALQVPIEQLTSSKTKPTSTTASDAVIGVWTSASRQKVQINDGNRQTAKNTASGPYVQVSRLGHPLVNELLIATRYKDLWNSMSPIQADGSALFLHYFTLPTLATLLPSLYPGVFPNLQAYNNGANNTRPDIKAIFLSGIPQSVLVKAGLGGKVPPTNVGGTGLADQLRLNVAQPPTPVSAANFSVFGYLGGDPAGFPNGRRPFDDVATIELRAVAGATLPLVTTFTPDAAVGTVGTDPRGVISFGLTEGSAGSAGASGFTAAQANQDTTALGTENYLSTFPYLGTPYSGYFNPSTTPVSSPN